MATAPNSMQSAPTDTGGDADAATSDGTATEDGSSGGFCVEIRVGADGTYSVGVEPMAEENSEEGGEGGGDDENYTPVKNVKAALTLALDIIRNGGEMPQAADDSFQKGFAGGQS